jgi:hypothetical protein
VSTSPPRGLDRAPQLVALIAVSLAAACADTPHGLLSSTQNPPPDVQEACALATTRCAHCHPIERVVVARGIGVRRWQMYVDEMRLKPSSGISPSEAEIIFRCLQFIEQACVDCKQGRS